MRIKKKVLSIVMVVVMLGMVCMMSLSSYAAPINGPNYPHVSVTKQVVQYYEESKLGLHGWQCESTTYTNGNIDWVIYANGGGYWSQKTVTKTNITEGWFHRWYTKTTTYKYFDYYSNWLPFH